MYYHIKIETNDGKFLFAYDKDDIFAKSIKNKFFNGEDVKICNENVDKENIKDVKIIKTPWTCKLEVSKLNPLRIDKIINNCSSEQLFIEYNNIITDL